MTRASNFWVLPKPFVADAPLALHAVSPARFGVISHRALRGILFGVLAAALVLSTPHLVPAQEVRAVPTGLEISRPAGNKPASDRSALPSAGADLWSMAGSLALVLAAILVLGLLLRSQLPAGRGLLPRTVVQDLGRRPLDARNTIHLVRCGSRILILGISGQGISPLGEITDPVEVDSLTGQCRPQAEGETAPHFGQLLKKVLGMPADRPVAAGETEPADAASYRLKSRLQSLVPPAPRPEGAHG